jgi:hypothetical protein
MTSSHNHHNSEPSNEPLAGGIEGAEQNTGETGDSHETLSSKDRVGEILKGIEEVYERSGSDEANTWDKTEKGIDGGAVLRELAQRVQDEDYELTPDDEIILAYMKKLTGLIDVKEGIDDKKFAEKHPGMTKSEGVLAEIPKIKENLNGQIAYAEAQTDSPRYDRKAGIDKNSVAKVERIERAMSLPESPYDVDMSDVVNEFTEASQALSANPDDKAAKKRYKKALKALETRQKLIEEESEMWTQMALLPDRFDNEQYVPDRIARARHANQPIGANIPANTPPDPGNGTRQSNPDGTGAHAQHSAARAAAGRPAGQQTPPVMPPVVPPTPPVPPTGGPANPNGAPQPNNAETAERLAREGRARRLENAKDRLANSGRERSKTFDGGRADIEDNGDDHALFINAVHASMQDDHPEYLDMSLDIPPAERNALINAYVMKQYNDVTHRTIEGMGGEKNEKKRKSNNTKLRLAATAVGFALGGPGGAVFAGALALGFTKGRDHEFNGRKKLLESLKEYRAEEATDAYLAELQENGGTYDPLEAFARATENVQGQYERGVVQGRRKRIVAAGAIGTAWFVGTFLAVHEAANVASYMGSEFRHGISTLDNPAGNPGYNYVPHSKPTSLSLLQWLYDTPNHIIK